MRKKKKEVKKRNIIVLQTIKMNFNAGIHIKTNKTLRRNFKQDLKKGNYE